MKYPDKKVETSLKAFSAFSKNELIIKIHKTPSTSPDHIAAQILLNKKRDKWNYLIFIVGTLTLLVALSTLYVSVQKNIVQELKWTNVTGKNQIPIQDIAIDTSKADKLSFSIKPLSDVNHKSRNYELVILGSSAEAGPYSEYHKMRVVDNKYRAESVTPYPGFVKLRLNINDNKRADVKVIVRVVN